VGLRSDAHALAFLLDPYFTPENPDPYTTWIQRGHNILELHYGDDEIEAVKDELNKVYSIYIYCFTKVPNCVWCHVTVREV